MKKTKVYVEVQRPLTVLVEVEGEVNDQSVEDAVWAVDDELEVVWYRPSNSSVQMATLTGSYDADGGAL